MTLETANLMADAVILGSCYMIAASLLSTWGSLRRAKLPTSLYVLYACFIASIGTASGAEVMAVWGGNQEMVIWIKLASAVLALVTAVAGIAYPKKLSPLAELPDGDRFEESKRRLDDLRRMIETR
jgi:CHASE2 domain-containing sensor protein